MNDFTKEELTLMFIVLPPVDATKLLKDKIQSMIDNYCEHSKLHTARDAVYCENCSKELT